MVDDFILADTMNRKKRIFTREHRLKISLSKKGKPHSPNHCKNISLALTGKTFSDKHRDRIRKALQGNRNALKNEIYWSDELIDMYGQDEECRKWLEENIYLLNESPNVKTDHQINQDNLKESILYDDEIKVDNYNSNLSVLEVLITKESLLKTSMDLKLSDII